MIEQIEQRRRGFRRSTFAQQTTDADERGPVVEQAVIEGYAGTHARIIHGVEQIWYGAGNKVLEIEPSLALIGAVRDEKALDEGFDFGIANHILIMPKGRGRRY
jgi:hypothetical protein